MEAAGVRKCVGRLLTRLEPALLVPKGPWSPDLQQDITRLDAGKDPASLAVKSALHLWNDDLHECHEIAQTLSDEFGAYLHGIMHRREPDYGNAKYWFRRVGEPPLFPQLRAAALELLDGASGVESIRKDIQARPAWDPFRVVDWCESSADEREVSFLRAIQAIEIQGLTYYWLDRAGLARP